MIAFAEPYPDAEEEQPGQTEEPTILGPEDMCDEPAEGWFGRLKKWAAADLEEIDEAKVVEEAIFGARDPCITLGGLALFGFIVIQVLRRFGLF